MKVTDLSMTLFNWRSPVMRTGSHTAGGLTKLGIVTVTNDEGQQGHSFLGTTRQSADEFGPSLVNILKPIVVGQNPLDTGILWEKMWKQRRLVWPRVIGAVDVALWDLAGKIVNQPVFRMLGACRTSIPAYGSSSSMAKTQDYVDEALKFKSMNWPAYKMHPHGNEKDDIEICTAVRKAVGDDYILMLDAMWAYQYEAALRLGLAVQDLGFFWYEDPLIEEDMYNYGKLREHLSIPLLNTEYAPGGLYGMAQWVLQRTTDILRGDTAVIGGLTPMIRLAHMADAFRMKFEIHHGGNSLMNAANLHVMMACTNCDFYEVFPSNGANKYGLVEDIEVDNKGLVHVPEKPGLGYQIDWDLVKREHVGVIK